MDPNHSSASQRAALAPVSSNVIDLTESSDLMARLQQKRQNAGNAPVKPSAAQQTVRPHVNVAAPPLSNNTAMPANAASPSPHMNRPVVAKNGVAYNYNGVAYNYASVPIDAINSGRVAEYLSVQAQQKNYPGAYNPLPRTQAPAAISVPGTAYGSAYGAYNSQQVTAIPRPIQTYPGQQYQSATYPAYPAYPAAASQYAPYQPPKPCGRIKFSLTSPKDFTILSSKYRYGDVSTDDDFVKTFRSDIERLSKEAKGGGATFEQPGADDDEEELLGTARWRVPLGCYDSIHSFFDERDDCVVEGIPEQHLRAANLHLQHLERGYPDPQELVEKGIPESLALTLTGYQRGGVNFVLSKNGRALIADEMGLGKTLQSIAAMCAYVDEGPLLVLCPSSVRFNWKAELLQWLGEGASKNDAEDHAAFVTTFDIQVFQSGKDEIDKDAKVIIASYDLFAGMVKKSKITETTFFRIIVDESHMLKNMKAARTKAALPILKAAKRCILLSGTPAFKNPDELFSQLHVLGGGEWWSNYKDFKEKYCYKSGNSSVGGRNNLELYSLMSSTVMIRRKKADVLKQVLPEKNRDLAHVAVDCHSARKKLDSYMERLRDTQGSLGIVARGLREKSGKSGKSSDLHASISDDDDVMKGLEADLKALDLAEKEKEKNSKPDDDDVDEEKAFLPKLFELTGKVKVPVVVSQLKKWLNENEGEKIIVFAHHHSVLDEIEASLKAVSTIRIDGKTNPKKRQEYVVSFQKDPRVRVAVLSTTAAGVGITLTASATVWFAEMYWTPGLLIQAEDRSHRIGQKNDVEVTYFVARDTLDEVLWKLAVRKFIAVGEMVDGSTNTLGVNKKGDVALLNVSLELGSALDRSDDKGGTDSSVTDDDNKEDAGWGNVKDVSPSKVGKFASADEHSSVDGSFDSNRLIAEDEIEEKDSEGTDCSIADDEDKEDAPRWGNVIDVSPSKGGEFASADEYSSADDSFDSNCLIDDDETEEEESDDDVIEVEDSDSNSSTDEF